MHILGKYRAVGLSAAAAAAAALLVVLGVEASAQDAKAPAAKPPSPCKGLAEQACKGKTAECLWIVPTKGRQKAYCRLRPATASKS